MKNPGITALNQLMSLIHKEFNKQIHNDDEITPDDVLQIFQSNNLNMYSGNMDTYVGNPVGSVINFMGTKPPRGYLICDGSVYLISEYPSLAQHMLEQFDAINHFGGDGVTSFAVPNLTGRFLLGAKTSKYPIGMTGGEENHTLTIAEMPSHNHYVRGYDTSVSSSTSAESIKEISSIIGRKWANYNLITSTGNGNAHNNMPPYYALIFCIKAVEDIPYMERHPKDEMCVGEYLGRPLYRRVITFTLPNSAATDRVVGTFDMHDVDQITNLTGIAYIPNQKRFTAIPTFGNSDYSMDVSIYEDGRVGVSSGYYFNGAIASVKVEYIKKDGDS